MRIFLFEYQLCTYARRACQVGCTGCDDDREMPGFLADAAIFVMPAKYFMVSRNFFLPNLVCGYAKRLIQNAVSNDV